jgi:uncharacterized protein (TIGR03437 family)
VRLLWAFLLGLPLSAADVAVAPQTLTFAYQYRSNLAASTQAIALTSTEPFNFTISRPGADGWLLISPTNNPASYTTTGPAYLPVGFDPSALGPGTYRSAITVRLPAGTLTIPVTLVVSPVPVLLTDPAIVGFDPTIALQTVAIGMTNGGSFIANPTTTTPWLSVRTTPGNQLATSLIVASNLARAGSALSAGSFQVSVFSLTPPSNNPLVVPVVNFGTGLSSPPPLTASPPALSFTGSGSQQVTVAGPAFTASADAKWVSTAISGQTLTVTVDATGLGPGTSQATITLNSGGVLQVLPVTLALGPVSLTKVVNGASWTEGAVSPGEVVVLGGSNLGPTPLAGLALDANGFVSSNLAGVQVTFDGIPAPLIYASATQVAAVAPYDLDGKTSSAVQVTVGGRPSNTVSVPVAAVAPGIFTADASGSGPAAAFRTGDIVSIYLTGEGQTTPAGINGKVTATPPLPLQAVTATLGGQPVEVVFAGEAPGVVSGVMQVNLRVPATAPSGDLPLVVSVGGAQSQPGVTLSVR